MLSFQLVVGLVPLGLFELLQLAFAPLCIFLFPSLLLSLGILIAPIVGIIRSQLAELMLHTLQQWVPFRLIVLK